MLLYFALVQDGTSKCRCRALCAKLMPPPSSGTTCDCKERSGRSSWIFYNSLISSTNQQRCLSYMIVRLLLSDCSRLDSSNRVCAASHSRIPRKFKNPQLVPFCGLFKYSLCIKNNRKLFKDILHKIEISNFQAQN